MVTFSKSSSINENDVMFFHYQNYSGEETQRQIAQTTMGIYVVRKEGADDAEEPETDRGHGAVD
ncbi:hypothetical protein PAMP_022888 [Pampus punctatissimus]